MRRRMTMQKYQHPQYLRTTALEPTTFTFHFHADVASDYYERVSYSIDEGKNWTTVDNDGTGASVTTPLINTGDFVLWRGKGSSMGKSQASYGPGSANEGCYFSSTGKFNVSGYLTSLLYDADFTDNTIHNSASNNQYRGYFKSLFQNSLVVNADNIILPEGYHYLTFRRLFADCSELISATFDLPQTALAPYSIAFMFQNCAKLEQCPSDIYGSTLNSAACYGMFDGCTSLLNAPVLHQTQNTGTYGYYIMFRNCKALVNAPVINLQGTIYAYTCYSMFYGCTSMINGGNELLGTTLQGRAYGYMYLNCTSMEYGPYIHATTLVTNNASMGHMYEMFYNCRSLRGLGNTEGKAEILPAELLSSSCGSMFYNCTNITDVTIHATTIHETADNTHSLYSWLHGISNGTLRRDASATWNVTDGNNSNLANWTITTIS